MRFFLFCAGFIQLLVPAYADTKSATDFAPEIAAAKLAISPLLSPLRQDYAEEIRIAEAKRLALSEIRKSDQETDSSAAEKKLKAKLEYHCFLNPKEINILLVRGNPVQKNFRFKKDCHIDGTVNASAKVFRVDLSLKESGTYFRVRYLMELTSAMDKKTGLIGMKARIFDGELFSAQREHEADFEFLANYSLVIDEFGKLVAPGSGTFYVKKYHRQKIDRMFPY